MLQICLYNEEKTTILFRHIISKKKKIVTIFPGFPHRTYFFFTFCKHLNITKNNANVCYVYKTRSTFIYRSRRRLEDMPVTILLLVLEDIFSSIL